MLTFFVGDYNLHMKLTFYLISQVNTNVYWIQLAQDKNQRPSLLDTAINTLTS